MDLIWIPLKTAFNRMIETFPECELNEKILKNWAKQGNEIKIEKRGRSYGILEDEFVNWENRVRNSIIRLSWEDYKKCLLFAVNAFYRPVTKSDFNRMKQRDVGEFITNQTQGKLGEIAVQKIMLREGLKIDLDFSFDGIPSQDITRVSTRMVGSNPVWNNPELKVSIKSTKLKNVLLTVPSKELVQNDRRSDMYVLSQVGLFPDHILRVIKKLKPEELLNEDLRNLIPEFEDIICRIGGFVLVNDLIIAGSYSKEQIQQRFNISMAGDNYIKVTGELSIDWKKMCEMIVGTSC